LGIRIGRGLRRYGDFERATHANFSREVPGSGIENVAWLVGALGMNLRAVDEMRDGIHVFLLRERAESASAQLRRRIKGRVGPIARAANFALGIGDPKSTQ
jgi:hypothetical protein